METLRHKQFTNPFRTGDEMTKHLIIVFGTALLIAGFLARVHADDSQKTLLVTMTNDPASNGIIVLDAATHARLQTASTNGKGGVGGNGRGVNQYNGRLFAAVNNGSGTVALLWCFQPARAEPSQPRALEAKKWRNIYIRRYAGLH